MKNIKNKKIKVMMHYVMPGALGGPNILYDRIVDSKLLNEKYDFVKLNQNRVAGGKLSISLIIELSRAIKKHKPDIIHISGMQSAGFHCMLSAVLAGCKNRVITTHGFAGDDLSINNIKKYAFNYVIEPLTLLMSKKVQCISQYTLNKKMVKKYAKDKAVCIYNFPPEGTANSNARKELRKELKINEKDIVFTSISRIVIDKGYKNLAEAIKMSSKLENIKFLIVGSGKYEKELIEYLDNDLKNKKVIFLGRRDDIMDILSASDVFILPTLHENLGNVFLEASKAAIPSIGSNLGGIPEIIDNDYNGKLINPCDPNSIYSAILELYYDTDKRELLGKNALVKVNTFFNSELISEDFNMLYYDLYYGSSGKG